MNWILKNLNQVGHGELSSPAMLEPLESRCLLSVSVAPPSLALEAQPASAIIQPAKLSRAPSKVAASAAATLTGTYTGTLHLAHTPKGFTGSRNLAFTLTIGTESADGSTSGTFSVPGLGDYSVAGTVDRRSLSADLSGPGSGSLKIAFTARTLALHGNFTSLLNGQTFTGKLQGGVDLVTPPTPSLVGIGTTTSAGGAGGPLSTTVGISSTTTTTGTGSTTGTGTTSAGSGTTTTTGVTTGNTVSGIDTGTTTDQSGIDTGTTVDQSGIDTAGTINTSGIDTGGTVDVTGIDTASTITSTGIDTTSGSGATPATGAIPSTSAVPIPTSDSVASGAIGASTTAGTFVSSNTGMFL